MLVVAAIGIPFFGYTVREVQAVEDKITVLRSDLTAEAKNIARLDGIVRTLRSSEEGAQSEETASEVQDSKDSPDGDIHDSGPIPLGRG